MERNRSFSLHAQGAPYNLKVKKTEPYKNLISTSKYPEANHESHTVSTSQYQIESLPLVSYESRFY